MSTQKNTTAAKNHLFPGPNLAACNVGFATAFIAPVLSVDLDNVIRDQIGAIIHAARRRWGVELERADFDRWDPPLGHKCGISDEEFTAWAWGDATIFNNAAPLPGAILALACLSRHYQIIVTTSTRWPELTTPWLARWSITHHRVIHTADKSSVVFDWHIDDSPATLATLAAANRPAIRWALPWNAHLIDLPVICNWDEVMSYAG